MTRPSTERLDLAIVGGGAAGLATAIFTSRERPQAAIAVFDGAPRLGAKILVSGGGRCNVTNRDVSERDFNGGSRHAIRRVLEALPVDATRAFFHDIGVPLHEEPGGKLFPDSNRSRTVVDALVGECTTRGVRLLTAHRVASLARNPDGFTLDAGSRTWAARAVVLATGGLSLPRTGSDGFGLQLARNLGHSLVETTPALVPLVLPEGIHASLAGVSHEAELRLAATGQRPVRIRGPVLWTHVGVSGPAVLDMSRHWLRARVEDREATLTACLAPGLDFMAADASIVDASVAHPRRHASTLLAARLPSAMALALCAAVGLDGATLLGELPRDARRRLAHALVEWPLPVRDSRGYDHAEATAGGVELVEIDPRTMHSRVCPHLFLVGEMLDVDGRLGGFNFQWAWASAKAAATGVSTLLRGA